jgi:hypothetical protein
MANDERARFDHRDGGPLFRYAVRMDRVAHDGATIREKPPRVALEYLWN